MEYYKKSLRLVKFLIGFVIFCYVYAVYIQPKVVQTTKMQQQQQQMVDQMLHEQQEQARPEEPVRQHVVEERFDREEHVVREEQLPQSFESPEEEEFVNRGLEEFRRMQPDLYESNRNEVASALRAQYRNQAANRR